MPVSYRWLPSPQAKITDKDGKPVPEFFNFFDEVSRRMGGQGGIADSCLLFSNQGVYTAAIIGSGLNLDRTTNTLTADAGAGFPEAPLDGRQYGRQMAQWTVVNTGTPVVQVAPGLPAASIQYNSTPAGTFTGSAEYTIDTTNNILYLGAANSWTIKPVLSTTAGGRTLTVASGASTFAGNVGGALLLTTGTGATGSGGITMKSADPGAGLNSGQIIIQSGDTSGVTSGTVLLTSGTGSVAGSVTVRPGTSNGASGGTASIIGGAASVAAAAGGSVNIAGGINTSFDGAGGFVDIFGGGGNGSGRAGGSVRIGGGSSDGSLLNGHVDLLITGTGSLKINGSAGTSGQVLTSSGTALPPTWTSVGGGQASIQFKDEGSNLGATGTVTSVNFVGAGVTATRSVNEITATIAGASPGGLDTYVQFNDSSAFGGDAGLVYNKTTDTLTGVNFTTTGLVLTAATTTSSAGIRLPHGTAPTTPTNGDVWTTTTGVFARINGTTVGPFGASTPAGSTTEIQFNNAGAFGASSNFTFTSGGVRATLTSTGTIWTTSGYRMTVSGSSAEGGFTLYAGASQVASFYYSAGSSGNWAAGNTVIQLQDSDLVFGTGSTRRGTLKDAGRWLFGSSGTESSGTETVQIQGSLSISNATMIRTYTAFTNGAAAAAGTLLNAPAAGNPTKWIPVNDNGTVRYIPAW